MATRAFFGVNIAKSPVAVGSHMLAVFPLRMFAADNGKVWLVLRPANTTANPPSSVVTVQSLLLASTAIPAGGSK